MQSMRDRAALQPLLSTHERRKSIGIPNHSEGFDGDGRRPATADESHYRTRRGSPCQEVMLRRGEKLVHWEVGADLRKLPAGDSVDLVHEQFSPGLFLAEGVGSNSLGFDVEAETVELTRWLLLPEGKEYRSFRFIRYQTGKPETAEDVRVATEYLAEDFTILAFKLLALKAGYTYEITWFYR